MKDNYLLYAIAALAILVVVTSIQEQKRISKNKEAGKALEKEIDALEDKIEELSKKNSTSGSSSGSGSGSSSGSSSGSTTRNTALMIVAGVSLLMLLIYLAYAILSAPTQLQKSKQGLTNAMVDKQLQTRLRQAQRLDEEERQQTINPLLLDSKAVKQVKAQVKKRKAEDTIKNFIARAAGRKKREAKIIQNIKEKTPDEQVTPQIIKAYKKKIGTASQQQKIKFKEKLEEVQKKQKQNRRKQLQALKAREKQQSYSQKLAKLGFSNLFDSEDITKDQQKQALDFSIKSKRRRQLREKSKITDNQQQKITDTQLRQLQTLEKQLQGLTDNRFTLSAQLNAKQKKLKQLKKQVDQFDKLNKKPIRTTQQNQN